MGLAEMGPPARTGLGPILRLQWFASAGRPSLSTTAAQCAGGGDRLHRDGGHFIARPCTPRRRPFSLPASRLMPSHAVAGRVSTTSLSSPFPPPPISAPRQNGARRCLFFLGGKSEATRGNNRFLSCAQVIPVPILTTARIKPAAVVHPSSRAHSGPRLTNTRTKTGHTETASPSSRSPPQLQQQLQPPSSPSPLPPLLILPPPPLPLLTSPPLRSGMLHNEGRRQALHAPALNQPRRLDQHHAGRCAAQEKAEAQQAHAELRGVRRAQDKGAS